jgi:hypothetical protein
MLLLFDCFELAWGGSQYLDKLVGCVLYKISAMSLQWILTVRWFAPL